MDAVAAPEPAVGAPVQGVEQVVLGLDGSQPSSTTTGSPSGASSPSASGMKRRFGVAQTQTPPKPRAIPVRFVPLSQKTLRRVELAVAVGVLEDQDAVRARGSAQPDGIRVVLDDPEPPLRVDGEGDRLDDVGLGGEEGGVEPLGQGHLAGGLRRRDGPARPVGRVRERADGGGKGQDLGNVSRHPHRVNSCNSWLDTGGRDRASYPTRNLPETMPAQGRTVPPSTNSSEIAQAPVGFVSRRMNRPRGWAREACPNHHWVRFAHPIPAV